MNLRTSPQVLACPFCGSSVEVCALSSEIWTLKPVVEKKAAWEIALSSIGEVDFIKGYLVPFSKPPISIPLHKKAPKSLKISHGEKVYSDKLEGFTTLSSNETVHAYIPYWYAKNSKQSVWISASEGSKWIQKDDQKNSGAIWIELSFFTLAIFSGFLWKFSPWLSIPVFLFFFVISAIWRPGRK
ncbi:hypothetical protein JXA84_06755 [candidate division WOR-3 bacterium]|nr:hypothetical protein [candidate division WOR-3 bacterium]